MSALRQVLAQLREESKTQREKGDYFERLALHYLKHDPVMRQQYENPQLFSDWAKGQGKDGRDTGIDIVAKISDEAGYCAVQCKFRKEDGKVSRNELAGFLAASGTADFSRRLVIDTTEGDWGTHAEAVIDGQEKLVNRITIYNLEESDIDWEAWLHGGKAKMREGRKKPRKDQKEAIKAVCQGLEEADRGKLIMPCGTGKTFTSLKIAEEMAGEGKAVLFLVPSLALMSQTIRAWAQDATVNQRCFAVCSDAKVDSRRKNEDSSEIKMHDLAYPATTDAATLAAKAKDLPKDRMTVVFATYQSIQVIGEAQKEHGLWEFDLIVCDEAHRTTGATMPGGDESNFVKVHYQEHVEGKKRLYMTATPRVFGDAAKSKAGEAAIELCSMDDEKRFGDTLFSRRFGWAVEEGLLTDYKVIVLGVDEGMISSSLQNALADESSELNLDDANKIIGCYRALTKQDQKEFGKDSSSPMRRALSFCRDIKRSKLVEAEFTRVVEEYLESTEGGDIRRGGVLCEVEHVDGTFNAKKRAQLIDWLKEGDDGAGSRILTNAKCLAEGVDVPALDAVLFMHPRKSQVDVVQSVGRVMRRAEGKKMGYIILPVGVPAGMDPSKALDDNKRYRLVWDTLNALRSHDERLESDINKAGLGIDISNRIEIIAVSNQLPNAHTKQEEVAIGYGTEKEEIAESKESLPAETQGFLTFDEWSNAVITRMVHKCGQRDYWEDWAKDIAIIAQNHISRIKGLVAKSGKEREALTAFLTEIQEDLNDSVTEDEIIEMLAQHLITRPVFDALFDDSGFVQRNPVSQAMQQALEMLSEHNIEKESVSLQKFYASVRRRVAGIDDPKAKQTLVLELYDKFFRHAFPKMTDRLGIVYTPVEIVDFILRSVDEILQKEFGQTVGSKGVHVIDPFAGTGTFITRLLQLKLIRPEELKHKYTNELHANEIILLAYYIAAINIESTYRDVARKSPLPFEGICLTDTFQLYEKDVDLVSDMMASNSNRRIRQKRLEDIRVIVGNPPYSVGQESVNNDAANVSYPKLDARIRETYAKRVSGNRNSLYDSYIRAIRWASDRIGESGVIGYVTNAGWLENKAGGGVRQSMVEEFSSIYVFHLRGNQRTSGDRSRKEGGKIFGSGSRAPIAITFLVKNRQMSDRGRIYFYDIGDYLTRTAKLSKIASAESIAGIKEWRVISPDSYGDWLNKRVEVPNMHIHIGGRVEQKLFSINSIGVETGRDAWAYNDSKATLIHSMTKTIGFYNDTIDSPGRTDINDPSQISWSSTLVRLRKAGKKRNFNSDAIGVALYRPFNLRHIYYDKAFNHGQGRMPQLFPVPASGNLVICITGPLANASFSVLLSKYLPDKHSLSTAQCFPLYASNHGGVNKDNSLVHEWRNKYAISDEGLLFFQEAYRKKVISKEDLFYYVYGLLHSKEYRKRFASNIKKELPRIFPASKYKNFLEFVDAGRKLGKLHCDFEEASIYPARINKGTTPLISPTDSVGFYRVEKMKFAGKRPNLDKTTVIYNSNITISDIPLEAYDYVVNGKPALEWVMERQRVTTDKDSGIVNDPNAFAIEARNNPAYPLELFQRVITVSLETMKIVKSLPPLDLKD